MRRASMAIAPTPEPLAGVPAWRFAAGPVQAWFLGRDAAARDADPAAAPLPAGIERAWLRQVHSARVVEARPGACGEADALIARVAGLAALVATADCVPVLLAGPGTVAAVHAGWRGIAAGVVGAAVAGLGPARPLRAWIGPAIGACCYEVGTDVAAALAAASRPEVQLAGPRGRPHADLGAAVAAQLAAAGVEEISRVEICTRCNPRLLWSYRRDGAAAGRNWAAIWRAPGAQG